MYIPHFRLLVIVVGDAEHGQLEHFEGYATHVGKHRGIHPGSSEAIDVGVGDGGEPSRFDYLDSPVIIGY